MKQLTAEWGTGEETVKVIRDGDTLVNHPVEPSNRSHSWLKPDGNGKTKHGNIGIISSLRNGCFRALTQCGRCGERCYKESGKDASGCYADCTIYAMLNWHNDFSVIHNGYKSGTSEYFHVHTPKFGYSLDRYPTKLWRVDSESSTSCMSLALGLTQRWAEGNPDKMFVGISSDYFHVPDDKLQWAADCGNIVIGHSLSSWFAIDDLRNRIRAARRFEEFGIPTVLWVATRPDWNAQNPEGVDLVKEAVESADARQIIEVPYHDKSGYCEHMLGVNPWGGCCEVGVDGNGEYCHMDEPHEGKWKGTCHGCKVLCGYRWLIEMQREARAVA